MISSKLLTREPPSLKGANEIPGKGCIGFNSDTDGKFDGTILSSNSDGSRDGERGTGLKSCEPNFESSSGMVGRDKESDSGIVVNHASLAAALDVFEPMTSSFCALEN